MKFLHGIFNIQDGADREKTIDAISNGVKLRGYNFWLLICSTLLASIGLDTNSSAVIIGAMLISPLMSPILGVGLSIAVHDKELLFRSVRILSLAVVLSLATSVLFFLLTPLRDATEEIQTRIYPTLLDVLVALFGGIAGIVSVSRKDATIAIPGVAIATALMPPLCTAGYGIATLRWSYFFGAFYLFFINAVFISLATFLIAKFLRFHEKELINKRLQRLYSRWFAVLSVLVILPSIYILYTVYKSEWTKRKLQSLVVDTIQKNGNEILKWELNPTDSVTYIKIYHSGNAIGSQQVDSINNQLKNASLGAYKVKLFRVNLTKDEISNLSAETAKQVMNELQLQAIKEKPGFDFEDSLKRSSIIMGPELRIAFPYIDTVESGIMMSLASNRIRDTLPIFFYKSKRNLNPTQKKQLYQYLVSRTGKDTIVMSPL